MLRNVFIVLLESVIFIYGDIIFQDIDLFVPQLELGGSVYWEDVCVYEG